MSIPVGVWARVSKDDPDSDSLEHHLIACKAYAERSQREVAAVYVLDGVSGMIVEEHPEYLRMVDDITAGRIKGLMFSKLERLARRRKVLLNVADLCQEKNAALICLDMNLDTSTPHGRMLYGIIAVLAEWDWENIRSRMVASVKVRAQLGKHLGGKAPFGYEWQDGVLVPHPPTASIRLELHTLFLEHRRCRTVATEMNRRGYKTQRGGAWSDSSVRYLLLDETGIGRRKANYSTLKRGLKTSTCLPKPEAEWLYHTTLPIIPRELWQATYHILMADYTKRPPAKSKKGVYPFSGFVKCHCGKKMYCDDRKQHKTQKFRCRACHTQIRLTVLEAIFRQRLTTFFAAPEALTQPIEQLETHITAKETLLAGAKKDLAQTLRDQEKTFQLFLSGKWSEERFAAMDAKFEAQKKALEQEIPRLEGELAHLRTQSYATSAAVESAQRVLAHWDDFSTEQKNRQLEQLVEHLIISPGAVDIHLAYIPEAYALEFVESANYHPGYLDHSTRSHRQVGTPVYALLRALIPA